MSPGEVAALIAAFTGLFGAIFAGIRNIKSDKFKKEVEASAALLTGYTGMVENLQKEIGRLKEDHADDRAAWAEERRQMRVECAEDVARLRDEHKREMLIAWEQLDELGSQIYVMKNRPPDAQERKDDKSS